MHLAGGVKVVVKAVTSPVAVVEMNIVDVAVVVDMFSQNRLLSLPGVDGRALN